MAKLRTTLFLSPDVLDALARHARTRRLGSASQAAEHLLRQALFCYTEEYVQEHLLPSIREAIREEFAALDGDGHRSLSQLDGKTQPLGTERQPPEAPDGRAGLAKAR